MTAATLTQQTLETMSREVTTSPLADAPGKLHGRLQSTIDSPAAVVSMDDLSRWDLVKSRLW